jgi:hypothetical protein
MPPLFERYLWVDDLSVGITLTIEWIGGIYAKNEIRLFITVAHWFAPSKG